MLWELFLCGIGATIMGVPAVALLAMYRDRIFAEEADSELEESETEESKKKGDEESAWSSDEEEPLVVGKAPAKMPKMIRKPRRRGKKIRFEGPGVDAEQMAEILRAADSIRNRELEKPPLSVPDFYPFELPSDQKKREMKANSIWEYNPHVLPAEFANMTLESYLVDRKKKNICHLPQDVLNRICSMLHPMEFVELSRACRLLHWKMFTFCTCRVPNTARLDIKYVEMKAGTEYYKVAPRVLVYSSGQFQGLFVLRPSCLKKPFFFETMELSLEIDTSMYWLAVKYVLPLRECASRLKVIHYNGMEEIGHFDQITRLCNELNATSFRVWYKIPNPNAHHFVVGEDAKAMRHLWAAIEPLRLMDEACVAYPLREKYKHLSLTNRFGIYCAPDVGPLQEALHYFCYSPSTHFKFHVYINLKDFHVLALGFQSIYAQSSEYYSEKYGHIWMSSTTNASGQPLFVKVYNKAGKFTFMIGRKKTFFKYQRYYRRICHTAARDPAEDDSDEEELQYADEYDDDRDGNKIWKMDTAVENGDWTKEKMC